MKDIIEILREVGGLFTDDHFVYTTGKHGSVYLNKDAIYPYVSQASLVGKMFAMRFKDQDIDIVVGPALGGIILSQWTAYHLSKLKKKEVLGVYTEKDSEKNQVFTRNYDKLIKGKQILIVEDITTTGGSVQKVVRSVKSAGGEVVGVGVMINRNPEGVTAETIGAPFTALSIFPAQAFEEKDCPMCKKNVPINTTVGHGKKYMQAKRSD